MLRRLSISSFVLLAACATPGEENKAGSFSAGQVNQRQQVKIVSIVSVQAAKISVSNRRNQSVAAGVGAVVGGVLGAAIGDNSGRSSGGGTLGVIVGSEAGRLGQGATKLIDGVQIIYRDGQDILSSAQVARPCDYALGNALMTFVGQTETRIQSNHGCVKGQENQVGKTSTLQGIDLN
jgi:outer membrane lipoprotein SlyB